MGWLKELMSQVAGGLSSYGELARRCLNQQDWPADSPIQERSLAAIFSKLDRGVDLEWLEDRPIVQRILAKVLDVQLDDIRAALEPRAGERETRRLRLEDLRYGRVFDLLDEALPPGIPAEVLKPGAWQQLYWHAGSGSCRSLVGRWLEARGLAAFICGRDWNEVREKLPGGPVFIELTSRTALPENLQRPGLCIASAAKPPQGWSVVHSPALEPLASEIAQWTALRLPSDGKFDPDSVSAWLRSKPLGQSTFESLGTVLGLCGLVDEHGLRAVTSGPRSKWLERFFRARVTEALEADAPHASWLKRSGYDALLGLVRRTLTDSQEPWDASRSFEAWLELVPGEHRREADVDWMRVWLSDSTQGIRRADAERAARRLPPGAYRLIRALEHARFLRERPGNEFALGPRWFSVAVCEEALASLVSGSPLEWGEALLKSETTRRVLDLLSEKLSAGSTAPFDDVLELEADHSPAHAAALEAAFRVAGLTLLSGTEVASELLEALWEEQSRFLIQLPGDLPRPRIEYELREAHERDVRAERGLFYAAAFAISEQLGREHARNMPLLAPFQRRESYPELKRMCDLIWSALEHEAPDQAWVFGIFSLVYRVRCVLGPIGSLDEPHALEQPGVILDEVTHGVLSWQTLEHLSARPLGQRVLHKLASERRVSVAEIARAIFHAWDEAGRPQSELFEQVALGAELWRHVPGDILLSLLASGEKVAFAQFGEEQWRVFENMLNSGKPFRDIEPSLPFVSEHAARLILQAHALSHAALTTLWQRFPRLLFARIAELMTISATASAAELGRILAAVPEAERHELALFLANQTALWQLPEPVLSTVRAFLHRWVSMRATGFRLAYASLSQIEDKLLPVRSLAR